MVITRTNNYTEKDIDRLHREIVHRSTGRMLIRPHLNRDWKIGLIGEAGDCKSVGGVKLTLKDFMYHGITCYSNMHIKSTIEIPDDNPWYLGSSARGILSVYHDHDRSTIDRNHT